jgi:hypothetical protein
MFLSLLIIKVFSFIRYKLFIFSKKDHREQYFNLITTIGFNIIILKT